MSHANDIFNIARIDRRAVYGGWLSSPSRVALEAFVGAGFDYIGIDTQHAPTSSEVAIDLLASLRLMDTPGIVRVSDNDPAPIGRALDGGASAVIVPLVETADEAEAAVAAAQFPPRGRRSFGPIRSDLQAESLGELDARGRVIVMIETAAGLANVSAIARVPGLTGLYIGPADMSISLGLPPSTAFSSDQLQSQFALVREAAEVNELLLGAHANNADSAVRWTSWGATLISVGSDVSLLWQGAADLRDEIRSASHL